MVGTSSSVDFFIEKTIVFECLVISFLGKNKTLGNECAAIIHVLHTTSTRALKLALTATLWNLSALGTPSPSLLYFLFLFLPSFLNLSVFLAENRGIIVQKHGLEVLSELLRSGDLGLQREAAGAIRNITLDGPRAS